MANNKTGLLPVQQLSEATAAKRLTANRLRRFCHVPVCFVANNYSKSDSQKGKIRVSAKRKRKRRKKNYRHQASWWRWRRRISLPSPFLFLKSSPSVTTNPQTLLLPSFSLGSTRDSDPSLSPLPPQLLPTVSATMAAASPSTISHSIPILDHLIRFLSSFYSIFFFSKKKNLIWILFFFCLRSGYLQI